ncbi:hypothetical protein Tco_1505987 [Tanacetum coccineum]
MIPKTERLQKYKKLRVVSYGLECVARPLLLFFSSKNRLLCFRYGVGVDTTYPRYWIRRIGVSWSRDHARIHRIFLDGYGVLVVRTVFSTWMAFGGNTHDLVSLGEETDEITDLHQILEEILLTEQSIERFLNNFANQPNETNMNDLESDDETVDTPLVSPFPHSDNDSDDGEVLNELIEKSVAYFDPYLPMNIIMLKAYNTIMVEGLESTGKNLVIVVRDVYVFVGSFTYIIDFVVLEDIGELIQINKAEVVMGKPFRKITKLEYDCAKGLMSFNRIFNNYTFQMPRTIPRLYLMRRSLKVLRRFHWMILRARGDGVIGIKRRRRNPFGDGVIDLVTALGRLESNVVMREKLFSLLRRCMAKRFDRWSLSEFGNDLLGRDGFLRWVMMRSGCFLAFGVGDIIGEDVCDDDGFLRMYFFIVEERLIS